MYWSVAREALLPRSGVGTAGPWLVIAPPNNPVVTVDLRLLDWVWHETGTNDLVVARDELEIALYIADGEDAITRLVAAASPWTRENTVRPTLEPEAVVSENGGADSYVFPATAEPDIEQFVFVGRHAVLIRENFLAIGDLRFRLGDVAAYAMRGANIPLANGELVQAGMAMLVITAVGCEYEMPAEPDFPEGAIAEPTDPTVFEELPTDQDDESIVVSSAQPGVITLRAPANGTVISVVVPLSYPPTTGWLAMIDRPLPDGFAGVVLRSPAGDPELDARLARHPAAQVRHEVSPRTLLAITDRAGVVRRLCAGAYDLDAVEPDVVALLTSA